MTLSYPPQRCILEHLEANKRILFAARCPSMQQIDKNVPIRLHSFHFNDDGVSINGIKYKFASKTVKVHETREQKIARQSGCLKPGEFLLRLDPAPFKRKYVHITYESKKKTTWTRRLPAEFQDHNEALKDFLMIVLGARTEIRVDWLWIYLVNQTVLRVPERFPKIHARRVAPYQCGIAIFKHLLHPGCFPLAVLVTDGWRRSYFEDELITETKTLVLRPNQNQNEIAYWHNVVATVPNMGVDLQKIKFTAEQICDLVRIFMDKGRSCGSFVCLESSGYQFLERLLTEIEDRFHGTEVGLKMTLPNEKVVSRMIAVPITTSSECHLVVYGMLYKMEMTTRIVLRVTRKDEVTTVENENNFNIQRSLFKMLSYYNYL